VCPDHLTISWCWRPQLHPLVADLLAASATADDQALSARLLGRAAPSKRWISEASNIENFKRKRGLGGDEDDDDEPEEEYDVSTLPLGSRHSPADPPELTRSRAIGLPDAACQRRVPRRASGAPGCAAGRGGARDGGTCGGKGGGGWGREGRGGAHIGAQRLTGMLVQRSGCNALLCTNDQVWSAHHCTDQLARCSPPRRGRPRLRRPGLQHQDSALGHSAIPQDLGRKMHGVSRRSHSLTYLRRREASGLTGPSCPPPLLPIPSTPHISSASCDGYNEGHTRIRQGRRPFCEPLQNTN